MSLAKANFSVSQISPNICKWKLVGHLDCFGGNRRTKDTRKMKLCSVKPLSPNGDQHQFFPNNIHTLSRDVVVRINKMITKEKMP